MPGFFKTIFSEAKEFSHYLKRFWMLFLLSVVLVIIFFIGVDLGMLGKMPSIKELANHQNSLATEIYSEDDKVLGRYYRENRVFVDYEMLPKYLVNALIATEDIRFYEHSGIDLRGLGRAFSGIVFGRNKGGGSTISQQLAKNLFPRKKHSSKLETVAQKFKEWVIAIKLERNYTKEEIIAMYLNTFDFLNQGVGIKTSSNIYFNTEPESLTLLQSATFVGMAKNPSLYNPKRRPELTCKRRNIVLSQMVKYGFLTRDEFNVLKIQPLVLNFKEQDHKKGAGTYFREFIRTSITAKKPEKENYPQWAQARYEEDLVEWKNNPFYGWCNKNKKPNGDFYDIYEDGLKIYSTINSTLQQYAEEAVKEHLSKVLQPEFDKSKKYKRRPPFSNSITKKQVDKMMETAIKKTNRYKGLNDSGKSKEEIDKIFHKQVEMQVFTWNGLKDTLMSPYDSILYYKSFFRAGFMAMEPHSGKVKAYVGGPNYEYFMYDMVTKGKRQVGSTIKPFLYTVAMQEGLTPCSLAPNVPQTILLPTGESWTPKNSGKKDIGKDITLKKALASSNNWISAWLIKQFGPEALSQSTKRLGIHSPVEAVYSNILGPAEIYVHEMVAAYNVFVNQGVYSKPVYVTRIEDKNGNILAKFSSPSREVMSANDAFLMVNMLKGVVNGGTANRLRWKYGIKYPTIGKTGTSNNYSDGWFMGITPTLITGTWVGAEDRSIHFESMAWGQGATMALPIYANFIKKVYADKSLKFPVKDFEKPSSFSMDIFKCDDELSEEEETPVSGESEEDLF